MNNHVFIAGILSIYSCCNIRFYFIDILSWNSESFKEMEDPRLTDLSKSLPAILQQARAKGTNKSYSQAFDRWALWASNFKEIRIFPAHHTHITLYITHLAQAAKSFAPIQQAICSLAWAHSVNGLENPTKHPLILETINGVKRMLAQPTCHKEPFTAENVKEFFRIVDTLSLTDVRNTAMIIIAFFGFMRISELLSIRRCHVTVHNTHIEIQVPQAKTDQLRQGRVVFISNLEGNECPVSLLQMYAKLSGFKLEQNSNAYLFARVIFKNKKLSLYNTMSPLSYNNARDIVKKKVCQINLDPKAYSTHSMRSGGATSAALAGTSERLMQLHG
jgi:integrase